MQQRGHTVALAIEFHSLSAIFLFAMYCNKLAFWRFKPVLLRNKYQQFIGRISPPEFITWRVKSREGKNLDDAGVKLVTGDSSDLLLCSKPTFFHEIIFKMVPNPQCGQWSSDRAFTVNYGQLRLMIFGSHLKIFGFKTLI